MTVIKIGTEIEWSCIIRSRSYESYWKRKSDGSIEGNYEPHEFITKTDSLVSIDTLNPKSGIDTFCEQFKLLVSCMSKFDVNKSQGIHFHVSGFSKKSIIFSEDFYTFFIAEYLKMCKTDAERDRVNSKEYRDTPLGRKKNYCRTIYNDSERYRAINYSHAYNKTTDEGNQLKTFEFRLFTSTKSVADFRRYLTFLVRCIAKFENHKTKEDIIPCNDDSTEPETVVIMTEVLL